MFYNVFNCFFYALGFSAIAIPARAKPSSLRDALTNATTNTAKLLPFKHEFTAFVEVNLVNIREVTIPEGIRVNADITGGNWTNPDGTLLANIIPGLGGENGYIDSTGVFHADARYTVQFVQDSKYGYVQFRGFGTAAVNNKVTTVVETDSAAGQELVQRNLLAPGVFVGDFLVAKHYAQLPL